MPLDSHHTVTPGEARALRLCAEGVVDGAHRLALQMDLGQPEGSLTLLTLAHVIALARAAGPTAGAATRTAMVRIAQRAIADQFEAVWRIHASTENRAAH
jgi:hypothetical protein